MRVSALIKINLLLILMIILSHCEQDLKDSIACSGVLMWKFPLKIIHTGMLLGNGEEGLMIRRYSHKLNVAKGLGYNYLIKNEKLVRVLERH